MANPFYVVRNDDHSDGIAFRTKGALKKYILELTGIKINIKNIQSRYQLDDILNTTISVEHFFED